MIFDRYKQIAFLEDELNAQIEEFKVLLHNSAIGLLNEHKLYLGLFTKYSSKGEMLLMMPWNRYLPRKNEQYYCFLLPNEFRKYKSWGNLTYKDLIKHELCATDVKCIWYEKSENEQFALVGFNQVSATFKEILERNGKRVSLVIGPKVPPYEYLQNLKKVVAVKRNDIILDANYEVLPWSPILIKHNQDTRDIITNELAKSEIMILQGPPGTGKTFQIAQLCTYLCTQKKAVLVTALTNQALISVAKQLEDSCRKLGIPIYKTALTADECKKCSYISAIDEVIPIPGAIVLGSFYKMSSTATQVEFEKSFDYVIVDEASQAFLATLSAAFCLGKKNMWVGDINQMPPISVLKEKRIKRENYAALIDGLKTVVDSARFRTYQLTETFRLGARGAKFTGMFYSNTLKSAQKSLFDSNVKDGPILVKMKMTIGDACPINGINKAIEIAESALKHPKTEVAILSHRIETVQSLQQLASAKLEKHTSLLVETVARVQGITKDVVIFLIPNTDSMAYCLEKRLFNVATSRARKNTYIIIDSDFLCYTHIDSLVLNYLTSIL